MLFLERYYPLAIALLVGCCAFFFAGQVVAWGGLDDAVGRLYAAMMNVSAIYTGFLANLWFTLHFASTVRLDKVRRTAAFQSYMRFAQSAFYLGLLAATLSVPMVMLEPVPTIEVSWKTWVFAGWAFMMSWSIAALGRVGQTYLHLADQ